VSVTGAGDGGIRNGDAVALWLMRAEGSAALGRVLRRYRLPDAFDAELTVAVIHAAELMDARGEAIDNVAAWTQRTLRLRALDLLKSPGSRRAVAPHDQPDTDLAAGIAESDDPLAELELQMEVDDLRRSLGARWADAHPWRVSGSLTFLSITCDGAVAGESCPQPISGATERDAALWASLYYAGERDLFPTGPGSDSAAQRQQRKRRMTHVSSLVGEAYLASQGARGA